MEWLQNGLQPHFGVTLFVSINFNESYVVYIISVIAALMLTLSVNGPLGRGGVAENYFRVGNILTKTCITRYINEGPGLYQIFLIIFKRVTMLWFSRGSVNLKCHVVPWIMVVMAERFIEGIAQGIELYWSYILPVWTILDVPVSEAARSDFKLFGLLQTSTHEVMCDVTMFVKSDLVKNFNWPSTVTSPQFLEAETSTSIDHDSHSLLETLELSNMVNKYWILLIMSLLTESSWSLHVSRKTLLREQSLLVLIKFKWCRNKR